MNTAGFKDQLRFEVAGQTLAFEARQGRPSANGTVTLYDSRYARTDASKNPIVTGAATRKVVDTTVTTASGASQSNPKRVFCVPPAALLLGDFVILTNAALQSERVKVVAITSGASFDVDHDLAFDYAIGATIQSAVMTSPAVPTPWASDVTNLGESFDAVWSYTVGGIACIETSRWDLVREVLEDGVPDSYLYDRFPDLRRFQFRDQPGTFQPQVRAAQRDVEALLRACNLKPHRLRANEKVRHLVELRTLVIIADNAVKPPGSEAESYFGRKNDEWERQENLALSGTLKFEYDDNEDGVLSAAERESFQVLDLIR